MFVLRRITSENNEINISLGDSYNISLEERNPDEYNEILKIHFMGHVDSDAHIYGFIVHGNGSQIIPLYKKSTYFVMTGDGKTFANITFKG